MTGPRSTDMRELAELGQLLDTVVELDEGEALVSPKRRARALLTWSPAGRTLFAFVGVELPRPVVVDEPPPRAAKLYETWTVGRAASRVRDLSSSRLPAGRWAELGPAIRIGYRSDKFHARGNTKDYEHEFGGGVRLYRLGGESSSSSVLAWRGGRLRVTRYGIEG